MLKARSPFRALAKHRTISPSPSSRQGRAEAENLVLRHQLNVEIAEPPAIANGTGESGAGARILLSYWKDPSFFAVGQAPGVHHQTVQRCVERAAVEGPIVARDDRPRPGREPTITVEAKAWLVSLACRKAKDLGYPHELWTTRLLAGHSREHGPAEGHPCLDHLAQGSTRRR
jgi:hypothetical protein